MYSAVDDALGVRMWTKDTQRARARRLHYAMVAATGYAPALVIGATRVSSATSSGCEHWKSDLAGNQERMPHFFTEVARLRSKAVSFVDAVQYKREEIYGQHRRG